MPLSNSRSRRVFGRSIVLSILLLSATPKADGAVGSYGGSSGTGSLLDLSIGINYSSLAYSEDITGGASSETATFGSTFAELGINATDWIRLQINYQNQAGIASYYSGTTLQGGQPVVQMDTLGLTIEEARLYLEFAPSWWFIAGYGIRNWYRGLGAYNETYVSTYTPIGIYWQLAGGNGQSFGVQAEVNNVLSATMTASSGTTTFNSQQFTLEKVTGYKLMLKWTEPLAYGFSISFFPWYERLGYGQSEVETIAALGGAMQEPSSKTIVYGLGTLLTFAF